MEHWNELPYPESTVLLTGDQELSEEVIDTRQKELENLSTNDVYEAVPFENQKKIPSCWIITEKFQNGARKVKACLVVRGFEEDMRNLRKDPPTCSRGCLHLVFSIAATMFWELQSIDITYAFLQEVSPSREIFLQPSSDVCPGSFVWNLKCIYGLNDAPRFWYHRIKQELIALERDNKCLWLHCLCGMMGVDPLLVYSWVMLMTLPFVELNYSM